ncbi:hypothetical protein AYI68_g5399 [Smittium mucronatum]|uniref:Uncharacterized protein n=1 Tax=Smittium mucronatum TaxID=133383 RepID=A0A1R0GUE4_9FUNG|nr:hypothetical protein AYI68_g5399 [Smittium mucronatum]
MHEMIPEEEFPLRNDLDLKRKKSRRYQGLGQAVLSFSSENTPNDSLVRSFNPRLEHIGTKSVDTPIRNNKDNRNFILNKKNYLHKNISDNGSLKCSRNNSVINNEEKNFLASFDKNINIYSADKKNDFFDAKLDLNFSYQLFSDAETDIGICISPESVYSLDASYKNQFSEFGNNDEASLVPSDSSINDEINILVNYLSNENDPVLVGNVSTPRRRSPDLFSPQDPQYHIHQKLDDLSKKKSTQFNQSESDRHDFWVEDFDRVSHPHRSNQEIPKLDIPTPSSKIDNSNISKPNLLVNSEHLINVYSHDIESINLNDRFSRLDDRIKSNDIHISKHKENQEKSTKTGYRLKVNGVREDSARINGDGAQSPKHSKSVRNSRSHKIPPSLLSKSENSLNNTLLKHNHRPNDSKGEGSEGNTPYNKTNGIKSNRRADVYDKSLESEKILMEMRSNKLTGRHKNAYFGNPDHESSTIKTELESRRDIDKLRQVPHNKNQILSKKPPINSHSYSKSHPVKDPSNMGKNKDAPNFEYSKDFSLNYNSETKIFLSNEQNLDLLNISLARRFLLFNHWASQNSFIFIRHYGKPEYFIFVPV